MQPTPGRRDVRLHQVVVQRRPGGAEVRDEVIGPLRRPVVVNRRDRQRIRRVARRGDRATHPPPVLRLAVVARRDHHHQPGAVRPLHGLAQRVVHVALEHRPPQRQVDDAQPELVLVGDRVVDGVDDVAGPPGPVRPQHLQAHQPRVRRDALELRAVAGDQARDVRAVAQLVLALAVGLREVHARQELPRQRVVSGVAAVDERDAYAAPGDRPHARQRAGVRLVRAGGLVGHVRHRPYQRVAGEVPDARVRRQGAQLIPGCPQHGAGLQPLANRQPMTRGHCFHGRPVGLQDHVAPVPGLHGLGKVLRQLGAGRGHHVGGDQQGHKPRHQRRQSQLTKRPLCTPAHRPPPTLERLRVPRSATTCSDSSNTRWLRPSVFTVCSQPLEIRL